ncbi:FMN-binding protein [Microbispora sp. CA-135349]|uniref:FMN-binding protein n=1 Tax=Microbispora sp. CA-135349 TaxID=3239953 RepID=UPI003D8DBF7B
MRRAISAVLATAVGLVLLLSFKPHEMTAPAQRAAAVAQGGAGGPDGSGEGRGGGFFGRGHDHGGFADGDEDGFGEGVPGSSGSGSAWTGPGATAGAADGEKTVTGDSADTRWGPVQVQIVISGGKLAGVKVPVAPANNRRDIEINNEALPILNEEALSARSAEIDTVSGATYTSNGYIRSLQSAIDKAGL